MASVVAQSYSGALFSLAKEQDKLDVFFQQLQMLEEQICKQKRFLDILSYPKINKEEKKQILTNVFQSVIDPLLLNFLKLLIDKSRFMNLHDIIQAYHKRYNKELNIEVAYVTSAKALDASELLKLQQMLEKKTNKKIEIHMRIDTSLLAGIRVQINDILLDNSALTRIQALRQVAQNSSYIKES